MNFKNITHKLGGLALAALMLTGITIFSTMDVTAQRRIGRRPVVIVRQVSPYRYYRPFRPFGWYGYGYGFYNDSFYNPYSQYIFDNSEEAARKAANQGYKTGEEDGRKSKSFSFERSHFYKEAGFGNFGEVYRKNFARGYENGFAAGTVTAQAKAREKAAKDAE
jgi:hypothetical protein